MTRALGVDYGQGFSLGRPIPLEKVLAALVAANIAFRSKVPDRLNPVKSRLVTLPWPSRSALPSALG